MDSVVVIKVISMLLYPLGLAGLFVVTGFLLRLLSWTERAQKLGRICYLLSVLILALFTNPQISDFLVTSLENQHPQNQLNDIESHDVIIVLGGGLRIPLPPAQYSQLNSASDRYWYAARLFKSGKAKQIILAGGNVYSQTNYHGESYYAAQLMQEWGIPESAIMLDDQSRTTEQNRDYVAQLIDDNEFKNALLVTSAMHMPRSLSLFAELSLSITPASADIIVRESNAPIIFSWLPSVHALRNSTLALHEYYGKWFAELKAMILSG